MGDVIEAGLGIAIMRRVFDFWRNKEVGQQIGCPGLLEGRLDCLGDWMTVSLQHTGTEAGCSGVPKDELAGKSSGLAEQRALAGVQGKKESP